MATATKTVETTDTEKIAGPAISKGAIAVQSVTPKIDSFISSVLPARSARAVWGSLPAHISPDVFRRNLYNALASNPALMSYPPALIYREVSKAAALGLLLDPLLGEAYMIEAYNGKAKTTQPQLRVGYKGMIKLARQSGNVATVYAREVCANDEVEANLGYPPVLNIKPVNLFEDRGQVSGYIAVISFKDGTFDFEPMSVAECFGIRDRSDAYKAFKKGLIKSTPWETDPSEMSKKTTLRRLMKRQDQSPQMRLAQQIEDEAEFPHMIDHQPAAPAIKAPAPPSETAEPEGSFRDINAERAARPKTKTKRGEKIVAPAPPAEPDPAMTIKELLDWAKAECDKVKDPDLLESLRTIVDQKLEAIANKFPPDVEAIEGIFRQAEKRLAP